jgi:acyl-coenzyme A synthetase/AMP-(fatty) acid ligase
MELVDPKFVLRIGDDGMAQVERREPGMANELFRTLMAQELCGLVLFTSGSTGQPKGVVHDFARLLEKFRKPRAAMVTLNFLLFDHWGGLNTLLHCLSSGSLVVLPEKRSPEYICELIDRHNIELLPTTPTFLNLLLLSRAFEKHDMSSLRLITYGAETMPKPTLEGTRKAFPNVEMRQTYGMIELGVLRAKSRDSESLWVKIGGEGYHVRVVEGLLQIKAESAMLGYINAPSPFTEDGYLMTGDRVEVDGEYLRILGRDADIINVGGEKVFPTEVEAVLLECPEVEDATVFGEANPITGQIVCAEIKLGMEKPEKEARAIIKRHCRARLQPFKVPVRILFSDEKLFSDRLKRIRRRPAAAP